MLDHDRLFKELLSTFFAEFVELFLPAVAEYLDRDSITFLDKEIFTDVTAGSRHVADLVVKARFRGRDSCFLVHVEAQSSQEGGFAERMFRYFARLSEKHRLPVYPVAVLSFDSPERVEPSTYDVVFPDFEVMRFRFQAIQLNQLSWRDYLRHDNPVAAGLMTRMNVREGERVTVKLQCLRMIASLRLDQARCRMLIGFVDSYLRLAAEEDTLLRQKLRELDAPQREVIMDIVTSWEERALEKGVQQGRLEGELALVLRLLRSRLGQLTADLESRVKALPSEHVEALAEALLDFTAPTDLERWLASRAEAV